MRQVTGLTSTYSSDVFGICSALYELGGMVVMHDASGCNSTYTTHDEPRWYDRDSMIYVSAISEMEAIMGDDEKWITDLTETAGKLHPKFIALVLAPIPYMIGTDVDAIAGIVESRSGIRCFAFKANGMHDYTLGISKALEEITAAYAVDEKKMEREKWPVVNLLGVTPLDFAVNESVKAMRGWVEAHGMKNGVCLAMDCSLQDVSHLADAQVNLVVSSGGLAAAKILKRRFGMPYVVGAPLGKQFSENLAMALKDAAASGEGGIAYGSHTSTNKNRKSVTIIGENVRSSSLASAIELEYGLPVRVLCPLSSEEELLRPGDKKVLEEDDLIREILTADIVIADPLYQTLVGDRIFYPLPHTAFSGRIYEKDMPNLIASELNCSGNYSQTHTKGKIC